MVDGGYMMRGREKKCLPESGWLEALKERNRMKDLSLDDKATI
jgi:hypothetical protein